MAAAAGLFNQSAAQAMAGTRVSPMADGSGSTGSTSDSSSSDSTATISANDFLTLLVTELQNQDPTTATDPNEYVNQLVEVNSLEQLININQTLTDALGDSSSTTSGASSANRTTAAAVHTQASTAQSASPAASSGSTVSALQSIAGGYAPGNLSIPQTNGSAERVAHALDGQSRTQSMTGTVSAAR